MKNRFKIARDYLGISQTEVADSIGLSRNTISKMESDKIEKPNVHYTNYLRKKGIDQDWLLYGKGEMLSNENISNNEDIEQIKQELIQTREENSSLRQELKELRQEMKQFLGTINLLSGKPSEHKNAANPNVKNNSLSGWSYVPAP